MHVTRVPTPAPAGTPRLTAHARARCAEMGISTKVAKRIARHAELRYPSLGADGRRSLVAVWSGDRDYVVVLDTAGSRVLTVLFRAADFGARAGRTYIPAPRPAPR